MGVDTPKTSVSIDGHRGPRHPSSFDGAVNFYLTLGAMRPLSVPRSARELSKGRLTPGSHEAMHQMLIDRLCHRHLPRSGLLRMRERKGMAAPLPHLDRGLAHVGAKGQRPCSRGETLSNSTSLDVKSYDESRLRKSNRARTRRDSLSRG